MKKFLEDDLLSAVYSTVVDHADEKSWHADRRMPVAESFEASQQRAEQAATSAEGAARSADEASKRAEMSAKSADDFDKRQLALMGVYQSRLNHEYDKGWEQIRIVSYVSAGVLVGMGLLLRDAPVRNPALLVRGVCAFGFVLALGSLINQIGSQCDARDLRKTLAGFEDGVTLSYYKQRASFWNPAGAAILLIAIAVVALWGAGFAYGPSALTASGANKAGATAKLGDNSRPTLTVPDDK